MSPIVRFELVGDAVMHDGAVGSGAGDGRKRHVLQQPGLATEAFERRHRVDLAQLAGRRLAREPCEEARERGAVALVRGARAHDFGVVLYRLHERDRIGVARRLAAVFADEPGQRVGRGGLVEPHRLAAHLREIAFQVVGRAHLGNVGKRGACRVVELGVVDIKRRFALARHGGEGQRQRRVRDIVAADVEGPGDVLRVRHHQHVGARLGDLGLDAAQFVNGALAGELNVVKLDRGRRRRRPVAPQRVDGVVVDRHQLGAGIGAGLAQPIGARAGVQPRVVAHLVAGGEVCLQPLRRRGLHQMLDGEDRFVDLGVGLHGVAAVDEDRRLFGEHDGRAGRAGEAGQPGQPLFARRQILILLAVRARHNKAVEPAPREFGPERRHPGRAFGTFTYVIECLEMGFEHGTAL